MTERLDRTGWLKRIERRTLSRAPGRINEARAAYRKLSEQTKIILVEEIVAVRSAELCLAYANLVDLSAGYKLKRSKKTGKRSIGRIPCVRLMVKRKWSTKSAGSRRQQLPRFIFAYANVNKGRVLCAVPTDVISATDFLRVVPQRDRIAVTPTNSSQRNHHAYGTIACVVRRRESREQLYAMSCRHVLSLTEDRPQGHFFMADVRVRNRNSSMIIGNASSLRGRLRANSQFSLDSQLAFVHNLNALRRCVDGVRLTSFVKNAARIPEKYWIQSHRGAFPATKQEFRPKLAFEIFYKGLGLIIHKQLMVGYAATVGGDSGSACTSRQNGGVLLGMHIAGPSTGGAGFVYMIPAWQIMSRTNYIGDTVIGNWELVRYP